MGIQTYVVVGASLAAVKAAQTLPEHRLSDPAVPLRDSGEWTSIRR